MELEGTRILLVDDDDSVATAFTRALSRVGFVVARASNGIGALELLDRDEYDAIVSDISMPGMNGIALLREVRNRDRDLPVLLVTGHPALDSAADAVDLGAMKYLMKPVLPGVLVDGVTRAARLYRLAKAKREALALLGTCSGEGSDRVGLEAEVEGVSGGELHAVSRFHRLNAAVEEFVGAEGRFVVAVHGLHEIELGALRLRIERAVFQVADHLVRLGFVGVELRALVFGGQEAGAPVGHRLA